MKKEADTERICDGLKIRYVGIFDFADLYRSMKFWLEFNGYGNHEENFKEEKYMEKIRGDTKEVDVRWKGEKFVSDYFSNIISVTFKIVAMKNVEIMKDGKKLKMNYGDIDMRISADFVSNRKGKWGKDSFIKKLYERFVVRDRIERYKIMLYEKAYSFHDEIKAYLNLNKMG